MPPYEPVPNEKRDPPIPLTEIDSPATTKSQRYVKIGALGLVGLTLYIVAVAASTGAPNSSVRTHALGRSVGRVVGRGSVRRMQGKGVRRGSSSFLNRGPDRHAHSHRQLAWAKLNSLV